MIGEDYPLYLNGIKSIINHVFDGRFTAEIAVGKACKVMYIAACILTNTEMKKIYDVSEYLSKTSSIPRYSKLAKIRKIEPEGYAYAVEATKLLSEHNFE